MPSYYDAFFLDPAREYYENASAAVQKRIDRMVRNICTNPFIDMEVKITFPFPPYNPILYIEDDLYAIYDFENNLVLAIWNIGSDDDTNTLAVPSPPHWR